MMIKVMESENIKLRRLSEDEIAVTIFGDVTTLSVDTFAELWKMTERFWNDNNLWEHTKEAKAEKERWQNEHNLTALAPIGRLR